jgi:hypothetical protein
MGMCKILGSIPLIVIFLAVSEAQKTFIVEFQASGKWSKDEVVKYRGKLPELKEFTSCHWEKDMYLAVDSTNLWAYCFYELKNDTDWKCVQLYYRGDRNLANREVIFGGYFYGWTNISIDVYLPVKYFRPRTWNHICWTYSSLTGRSELFYNGKSFEPHNQEKKKIFSVMPNGSKHPIIPSTENVYKHLFVLGQEPDNINDGGYSEEQAVFGSIAEFNLWNKVIDPSLIYDAANCKKLIRGNVIKWQKDDFEIKKALTLEVDNILEFCEQEKSHVVFTKTQSIKWANETCTSHGGSLLVPRSEKENQKVFKIMQNHVDTCMPRNRGNYNSGKLIWLGLRSEDRTWFQSTVGDISYTNWGVSVRSLSAHSWKNGCAFMTSNGSWAYAGEECFDMLLCFVCSIPTSTVFTFKGTCKKGSVFQWNYYPSINATYQISSFEGYKRVQNIINANGMWKSEVDGAMLYLENKKHPIGRKPWKWYERSCGSSELIDRNMTLSICILEEEFTCDSGHCIKLNERCDSKKDCKDGLDEKECAHIEIPEEYAKIIAPKISNLSLSQEEFLAVNLRLLIENINRIDTKNMVIEVTLGIEIMWREPRLAFKNLNQFGTNFIDAFDSNRIWLAIENLEHRNAVIGKIHEDSDRQVEVMVNYMGHKAQRFPVDVFENREEYRYKQDENVIREKQRFRIEYECAFDLQYYPFDKQACNIVLKFKSSDYLKMFVVKTNDTISYATQNISNKYILVGIASNMSSSCSVAPNASNPCFPLINYTVITNDGFLFTLHLQRNSDHHIKTVFMPCIGLWIVAYFTVLLRVNDFTTRNRISVTVLLATVTLFGATANTEDYPKTTYLKFIDVWFLFHLASIFLIISHHMAVEMLWHEPSEIDHQARNSMIGAETETTSRRHKQNKQWYLNRIMAIFFPTTMVLFNIVYYSLMNYH